MEIKIMEIKVIEMGCNVEIKFVINGIPTYTQQGFDNERQALKFLAKHGLRPTSNQGKEGE